MKAIIYIATIYIKTKMTKISNLSKLNPTSIEGNNRVEIIYIETKRKSIKPCWFLQRWFKLIYLTTLIKKKIQSTNNNNKTGFMTINPAVRRK